MYLNPRKAHILCATGMTPKAILCVIVLTVMDKPVKPGVTQQGVTLTSMALEYGIAVSPHAYGVDYGVRV